ncbi:hypothetical protein ACFWPK_12155 [Nocardia sp. NPDC058519]|uniref:hypothetical protein n=1 Tax=Nocardia sp. NPDC058519 TaxID=3346535 RepID=UPI003654BD75
MLLVLALHRIRSDSHGGQRSGAGTGLANPLTQLLLALGLAKACRIRHITDNVINPILQDWTGVANVMSLAGMTFGALAAIPLLTLVSYITGRDLPIGAQAASAVAIVVAMVVTFLSTPMADTPTEYMSNDFPVTGPVVMYWIAYLGPLASAVVVSAVYAVRELTWVRRGPFAAALGFIVVACTLGLTYCVFKILNLVLQQRHSDGFWYRNAEFISIALGLAAIAAAGSAAGIYAAYLLKDRLRRYRLLRHNGDIWVRARTMNPDVVLDPGLAFGTTRRACWAAARSPEAAYRLQIELADHAHSERRAAATSHAISRPGVSS